jgi:hypothetical protein
VLGAITDHFRGFGADLAPPPASGATSPQVEGVCDLDDLDDLDDRDDLDDLAATLPGDDDATPPTRPSRSSRPRTRPTENASGAG